MARLVAGYVAHRRGCEDVVVRGCPCDPYEIQVDVEFEVPEGAGVKQAIWLARRAGLADAARQARDLDAGRT